MARYDSPQRWIGIRRCNPAYKLDCSWSQVSFIIVSATHLTDIFNSDPTGLYESLMAPFSLENDPSDVLISAT